MISNSSSRQEEQISVTFVLGEISVSLKIVSWLMTVSMEQIRACLQEEKFINHGSALNITSIEHSSKEVTSDKSKLSSNIRQDHNNLDLSDMS